MISLAIRGIAVAAVLAVMVSCGAASPGISPFTGDLRPPGIIDAGPNSARQFELTFDEDVFPVPGSYAVEPGGLPATATGSGPVLKLQMGSEQEPGMPYRIAGEAKDRAGNVTRFVFSFTGWNGNPALLAINEVQPGKNSSTVSPHRDYVEFTVLSAGNLGGLRVEYASTVKDASYVFPPAAVRAGDIVVLHCAPEGIPEERDETGTDTAESGGVDTHPAGRDFWCAEGGLPDASGLVLIRGAAGSAPMDGLFYAESGKSGAVDAERISLRLAELSAQGLWRSSGTPGWEEAFQWKPSGSRPLHRLQEAALTGATAWYAGESGTQSPGVALPAIPAKKSPRRASPGGGQ